MSAGSLKLKIKAGGVISSSEVKSDGISLASVGRKRPRSILDYLSALEEGVLSQLYNDTFTCLTIFRSLPDLAKQYILRLLCIDGAVPSGLVDTWCKQDAESRAKHLSALHRLAELQLMVHRFNPHTQQPCYLVNPSFQFSLRRALANQVGDLDERHLESHHHHQVTAQVLDDYATHTWDQLLHYMVGLSVSVPPPSAVQNRLLSMGLMESSSEGGRGGRKKLIITNKGFAFLFKDQHTQVWDVIISYIESLEELHLNRDDVLRFLFRLSFLKLEQEYPVGALTPSQQVLMRDLAHFGLVYLPSPQSHFYYPTRLALSLSSTPTQSTQQQQEGFLILETTFKIYAFTSSPLHLALLSLFVRMDYRLPDVAIGTLTKMSVRNALKKGITSNELISYLSQYCHPQMRKKRELLPVNVTDQIRLWEEERDRMEMEEAVLFQEFKTPDEFHEISEYAKGQGAVLICNAIDQILIITAAKYDDIKNFATALKESAHSRADAPPMLERTRYS